MRGLLTGIVSGVLVSGLGLVAAERFLPMVDLKLPAPDAGEVAVPVGSEFNRERSDAPPILPGTDAAPGGGDAPEVVEPDVASDSLPDTTPLDEPETVALQDTNLTAPADAPPPVIVTSDPADGLAQGEVNQPAAPQVDTAAEPAESPAQPETATAPETPAVPVNEVEPEVETSQIAALPETSAAPETPAEPAADVDAPPVALPDAPDGLRLAVPEIEDMTPGITTDRLPRIGAAEPEAPPELMEPALKRNAVAFDAGGDNPLVSVILVDVGPVRPEAGVFADFPLPLTVAIDPTAADAADLMQAYRQAGLEVAILTPLPDGAAPADVEVAFQSFFAAVPEAVAVMDLPEAKLQESRPRAVQVVEILAETGHGMVTFERGLNTGLQIASQLTVPAATVFRDIDPGTHDVAAMKRFLDQAAFRAGQDGYVILRAEARPETLTALAEWSLGSRAATVTFAPLSAVLGN